jgi:UDP-N-acetylmuramate--alanine ligase
MEELRTLFGDFLHRAKMAVLNLDDPEAARLAAAIPTEKRLTFGFSENADLRGGRIAEEPLAISFEATCQKTRETFTVRLKVPGRHNASNALAAILAATASGIAMADAVTALASFTGLKRRFEVAGTAGGVTVIDDFGHNPDKIAATLAALHAFPGRLLVMFQPHGYGPLKVMKDELIAGFVRNMAADDVLVMCDPAYFGGTVSREVGSADIVSGVNAGGREAIHIPDRGECGDRLVELARPGDRIIVMGARDDTLSEFAAGLVARMKT